MYPTPTLTLTHIIIYRRITDGRIKRSGAQCNFYIYYDFDGEEVATALPAAITDSKKTQKNVTRSSYRPLSSFLARLSTTITTPPILVMSTVLNRRNICVNGCCE